jgi:hypothetical protein
MFTLHFRITPAIATPLMTTKGCRQANADSPITVTLLVALRVAASL